MPWHVTGARVKGESQPRRPSYTARESYPDTVRPTCAVWPSLTLCGCCAGRPVSFNDTVPPTPVPPPRRPLERGRRHPREGYGHLLCTRRGRRRDVTLVGHVSPVARPSPSLCDAVRHGQQLPSGTVPPTPVQPAHRTLEKGRRNPQRDDARLLRTRTGQRRDVRPVGAVASVAISPVRPSPPPRRHPDHCITIPDDVEACGDRTSARPLLCLARPHVNGTLESSHGRPSNEQPLRHPPRSHSWIRTRHAVTPCQKRDSPGQPSTPWYCTPCLHT
jgi:hypothetical protein